MPTDPEALLRIERIRLRMERFVTAARTAGFEAPPPGTPLHATPEEAAACPLRDLDELYDAARAALAKSGS